MTTAQPPRARIEFGGDVNPEQWDARTHRDDLELMRTAGVTIATLGVFDWSAIEPEPGRYDFDRLDRSIGDLHDAGIAVDLATPTAAPPIWLLRAHPEIRLVSRTGLRYEQGGRLGWCPSSPVFREHAVRIADVLSSRYGRHPAVRLWHLGNEYGGGNRRCYCDVSAAAFQRWLADRYGTPAALNAAWGTAFWGHRYRSFDEVLPPRDSESIGLGNPGLVLDFDRFSSWELHQHYLAERAAVLANSPGVPITTNFMVGVGPHVVDYAGWAADVDVVANDHYVTVADEHRAAGVAFAADRTRGLAPDRPWLLMETAAGAVSWQPVNRPPEPGELRRTAITHVARGADGVLFFQWRQSIAGAEQFHSGMVPHAGADSRTFREITALGADLRRLAPVAGSVVERASIALLVDDESGWAWDAGPKPVQALRIADEAARWHRVLGDRGHRVDVVPAAASLDGYDLLLVPALFLIRESTARSIAAAVAAGAEVVVSWLSGIVDERNTVVPGGYPGVLRETLGIRVTEHVPLLPSDVVVIADDAADAVAGATVTGWAEDITLTGAESVADYALDGTCAIVAGRPAITRHRSAAGSHAWYVSARLDDDRLALLLAGIAEAAGARPVGGAGLAVTRRIAGDAAYCFVVNHSPVERELAGDGLDLLTGTHHRGTVRVPAGGVVVIEESA